jgi:hypothetical protein
MNHDFYFIPLILDARDTGEPEQALREADRTIRNLGRLTGYERGFEQYPWFMQEVVLCAKQRAETDARGASLLADELIIALATDTFSGTEQDKAALLERIRSRPDWRAKFERICSDVEASTDISAPIEIMVMRDTRELEVIAFSRYGETHWVRRVTPGHYVLRLSTGRVLWRGDIGVQDVEWGAAFPERALDLAADTEGAKGVPTRIFNLLEGELTVRILPGIEAGTMKITWNGQRSDEGVPA